MAISTNRLIGAGWRGVLVGGALTAAGIAANNLTRNPDKQTVTGIDNTTLIAIAVAAVAFAWLTSRR